MHVVLTVDPEIPVPPRHYGGIERIVDMLIHGLQQRGHRVTLFAHPESTTSCDRIAWRGCSSSSRRDTLMNMWQLTHWLRRHRRDVDVVHSFARLAYLLPVLPWHIPKVQSYQRKVTPRSVWWGHRLGRGTLSFTACSKHCAAQVKHVGRWRVIYNGVPLARYRFVEQVSADAPLMFLGRLERIKGPHHAVRVARLTGRRLIVAGNLPTNPAELAWCQAEVLAHCDGRQIEYIGAVDDSQKSDLLGRAAALLFPIEWEEPFGIVMAEALACGTPVLAFSRGAVSEVIEHGVTGWIGSGAAAMVNHVEQIGTISRLQCRSRAEEAFSESVIVEKYESFYRNNSNRAGPCIPGTAAHA